MTSELVAAVHARLLDGAVPPDAELATVVDRIVAEEAPLLGARDRTTLVREVLASSVGLGPLEPLVADGAVSEIMVNGDGSVWVERHGGLSPTEITLRPAAVALLVERILSPLGLRVDRAQPLVDARLPDGSRVNVVVPPASVDGPCLTIRRFTATTVTVEQVAPAGVAALLEWAVEGGLNVVVSGGTGSGKTTLLNSLCGLLAGATRVVTIEDAAELQLPGDQVVRLEAQRPNAEGVGEVTIRQLVRNALRMRPDRIVVGEVRGPEALDMVWAMSTGHDGSLSTCHANDPEDALRRLEAMVLQAAPGMPVPVVRSQLVAAVDLLVHVARTSRGRRVVSVAEPLDGAVRTLADDGGLLRLPRRPPRRPGHRRPERAWLDRDEAPAP